MISRRSLNPEGAEYYAPRRFTFRDLIRESNKIEGIFRDPTDQEITAARTFCALDIVTIDDLIAFVKIYQPDARLRDRVGINVRVGTYLPPAGSPKIKKELQKILDDANANNQTPYMIHQRYEKLHPFTDGNGRSGRILWLRMVNCEIPLGFLHQWYYHSLSEHRLT